MFIFLIFHIIVHNNTTKTIQKQYLQVRAQKGLPLGVLVVVSHQQIEQGRRLGPQRRQLGDAALEYLAAQGLAQRHAALEEHGRKLAGQNISVLKGILWAGE